MLSFNSFFDGIFCINLDKRTDRWETCQQEFLKHGIKAERYSAFDGSKIEKFNNLMVGEVGALRSHRGVIEEAKRRNLSRIVIFEDDVELADNFSIKFITHYFQVQDDWQLLYLGGNHVGGLSMVGENVARIHHSYAIHAYCVKSSMYDIILNKLEDETKQVDVHLAELQSIHPAYVFRPHLAFQRKDYSDIQGGEVDYDFLRK